MYKLTFKTQTFWPWKTVDTNQMHIVCDIRAKTCKTLGANNFLHIRFLPSNRLDKLILVPLLVCLKSQNQSCCKFKATVE